MSFGFSPGDIVMALRALHKGVMILKREAMDGYGLCVGTYMVFDRVASRFGKLQKRQQDQDFQFLYSGLNQILGKFLRTIKEFEPFLGKNRQRHLFRGAIEKFKWSSRIPELDKLAQDLMMLVVCMSSIEV